MREIDNRYRIIFSVICNRRRIGRRGSFREDHKERSIIQFIISRRCCLYEEIAGAAYQRGECRFTASVCLLGSDAGRRCNGTSVQRCGRNPEGRTRKKSSSGSAIVLYDIESGIPDVRRRTGSAVIDGALDNSSIVVTVADHTGKLTGVCSITFVEFLAGLQVDTCAILDRISGRVIDRDLEGAACRIKFDGTCLCKLTVQCDGIQIYIQRGFHRIRERQFRAVRIKIHGHRINDDRVLGIRCYRSFIGNIFLNFGRLCIEPSCSSCFRILSLIVKSSFIDELVLFCFLSVHVCAVLDVKTFVTALQLGDEFRLEIEADLGIAAFLIDAIADVICHIQTVPVGIMEEEACFINGGIIRDRVDNVSAADRALADRVQE